MTRAQTWGGRTAEERRADRREKLMTAAAEIWAEGGWAAVTMRGVCTRAGVIDRYFYENFADRDDLLIAVWDDVRDQLTGALLAAQATDPDAAPLEILQNSIAAIVLGFAVDKVRSNILFAAHSGSPALEHRRHRLLVEVSDVMVESGKAYIKPEIPLSEFRQSVLMGVGGFLELIGAWHAGVLDVDAADIVEQVTHFGEILGRYYLPGG